ncbi:proprotein convertase subtilisin/kexin type 5 isoform X2 [Python bivittatus]|uniref:Proprotein convertase subtilisin/kexin type 5 isoform X1 n=1 Tax=Python bivittatus TaxID=176946 RepID=A0A9F5J220_PYTBI|nr:proprotein convertase subtilisin/kexin type 5 isoform X1 [Python bivittatus]XP_025031217.1 proprotein convertase subtilisin/kexin type 5 isoform X2 [Python bivittatus]
MYNQQCYRTCPQNTVPDDSSHLCIECQPNCRSCDRYECYWCEEGFFLLGGKCVRDCGAGFYKDEITEECEPCHRTCKTCRGVNYNDCTSCQGILQLLHGKCVNPQRKEIYGKFWNERLKLHTSNSLGSASLKDRLFPYVPSRSLRSAENDLFSVSTMHQIETERALKEAFLENAPVLPKAFPFKVHQNPSLSVVRKRSTATDFQPCVPSCKTCEKAADRCTSCHMGQFLFAGSCGHDCPPQTFRNTKTKQCENCTEDCEECTANQHCLKCLSSPSMPRYLHRGECLQECPTGFFAKDGKCKECNPPCKTCGKNATMCLSCERPLLLEGFRCKPECSEGHFATDRACEACPKMCQECIHQSKCKVCIPPFHLHNGMCLQNCPSGFYPFSTHCFTCHELCRECEGPEADDCIACPDTSYALYKGRCIEDCPDGTYYEEEAAACKDCHETCKTCSSATSCFSCEEGLLMTLTGVCVIPQDCLPNWYYDSASRKCRPCHKACFHCKGPGNAQCLSCPSSWHLLNTTCVSTCPDGYYEDTDSQCYPCHRTCKTCHGKHSTQCLLCPPNWYKEENLCVQNCTAGYYANSVTRTCERCHKSCQKCLGPAPTECLSCAENFFLLRSSNECLFSCPEYYYADLDTHACKRCHPTCHTCKGKGEFKCTTCVTSYHFFAGICNSVCLLGEYQVSEVKPSKCEKCHDSCMQCKGPGPFNCTSCHLNMELYVDEYRCVPCCKDAGLMQTQECCNCTIMSDECILVVPDMKTRGKTVALTAALLILLSFIIGATVFIWRRLRARPRPVNHVGYKKLADNAQVLRSFKSNQYQSSSYPENQVNEYKDRDDDDDDDDDDNDIVYMSRDGTVYRKFKYGLLEDDDIDELEYDDESYSFR